MATERNRQLVLVALLVVLGFVLYRVWPGTSAAPAAASNRNGTTTAAPPTPRAAPAGARASTGTAGQGGVTAPDVRLEALDAERPKPRDAERNLFRFKPKAPPPPPPAPPRQAQAPVVTAPAVQGPPPLPPIGLKFIGIIESPSSARKIAVLSDGRNPPFQGVEGDIIEGRYRIIKIGVESVEIAYADGRGRQTIRLTGS